VNKVTIFELIVQYKKRLYREILDLPEKENIKVYLLAGEAEPFSEENGKSEEFLDSLKRIDKVSAFK
jgi:hypothetical protein